MKPKSRLETCLILKMTPLYLNIQCGLGTYEFEDTCLILQCMKTTWYQKMISVGLLKKEINAWSREYYETKALKMKTFFIKIMFFFYIILMLHILCFSSSRFEQNSFWSVHKLIYKIYVKYLPSQPLSEAWIPYLWEWLNVWTLNPRLSLCRSVVE